MRATYLYSRGFNFMKDKQKALNLIDQLIEIAQEEDKKHKLDALGRHKAGQAIGESAMVFYLKAFR